MYDEFLVALQEVLALVIGHEAYNLTDLDVSVMIEIMTDTVPFAVAKAVVKANIKQSFVRRIGVERYVDAYLTGIGW